MDIIIIIMGIAVIIDIFIICGGMFTKFYEYKSEFTRNVLSVILAFSLAVSVISAAIVIIVYLA